MIVNLDDYTAKIIDFNSLKSSEMIDYFLYYLVNFSGMSNVKSKDVEQCFITLSIPPYSNINKYLLDNSKKFKGNSPKFLKSNSYYSLTRTRSEFISKNIVLDTPKVELINSLRSLLPKVVNINQKEFLEEAIKTFEIEAYRASIIMVWLLTLDHLFEFVMKNNLRDFINALRRMNNSKTILLKDDFGDIKESVFIEACRGANIISNDVRKILDAKLSIRNSYAHPSNIQLPKSKALYFIEDLIVNVVLKYPI